MVKIERFEDSVVWQKSRQFTLECYNNFSALRDFSFRDQIQRAAVSIMNNIAEGFERRSNKEFVQFLYISKGSCAEVRSMLYLSLDLKYIDKANFTKLYDCSIEISRILHGLIKTL
ncbi:MAG TPA: four helix bundle protein [bacterium]|nr:four helix bundle protein [bacterium]